MFGFREIRTSEKNLYGTCTKKDEEFADKRIRPTGTWTDKDCDEFWMNEFRKASEEYDPDKRIIVE